MTTLLEHSEAQPTELYFWKQKIIPQINYFLLWRHLSFKTVRLFCCDSWNLKVLLNLMDHTKNMWGFKTEKPLNILHYENNVRKSTQVQPKHYIKYLSKDLYFSDCASLCCAIEVMLLLLQGCMAGRQAWPYCPILAFFSTQFVTFEATKSIFLLCISKQICSASAQAVFVPFFQVTALGL